MRAHLNLWVAEQRKEALKLSLKLEPFGDRKNNARVGARALLAQELSDFTGLMAIVSRAQVALSSGLCKFGSPI